jgi:hypothetical protein
MFRLFSAGALSLALAFSSVTATPARADGRDVAKVLGGLTLLYIIGKAVENDRRPAPAPPVVHAKPKPVRPHAEVIPATCYREHPTRAGVERGYGARCMQNNVRSAGSLPPQCIRQVQTYRGWRNLYDGRCLKRNGWVQS